MIKVKIGVFRPGAQPSILLAVLGVIFTALVGFFFSFDLDLPRLVVLILTATAALCCFYTAVKEASLCVVVLGDECYVYTSTWSSVSRPVSAEFLLLPHQNSEHVLVSVRRLQDGKVIRRFAVKSDKVLN
jgi:hypothetical protein